MRFSILFSISFSKYLIYNANASLCYNYQHWCQENGTGLNLYSPGVPTLDANNYKTCLHHCDGNTACKGFEYDPNEKMCRFSAFLFTKDKPETLIYWKTTTNVSCAEELSDGKL